MERFGDWLLFLTAAGLLLLWLWRRFNLWLLEPPNARLRRLANAGEVEPSEAVALLEEQGFEVLSGKHRIPLRVAVDDQPSQPTRLYFDYLAQKDHKYYLVKMERWRNPMEWTASGLRERLLPYALLFPESDGIVVVDLKERIVRTVRFKVEDEKE
ncbi:hypothetical protein [Cohnella laeviribosi]|uniref:hypothetical protein n=1 Tax=Cohnella laeviribosi TaxID=380174 RepID=UPI000363C0EF|nr:hypothetical protein [Cohnella laeviribosi]REK66035.1 MAG: hypothetical protein C6P35_08385 [Cohnella sp.]